MNFLLDGTKVVAPIKGPQQLITTGPQMKKVSKEFATKMFIGSSTTNIDKSSPTIAMDSISNLPKSGANTTSTTRTSTTVANTTRSSTTTKSTPSTTTPIPSTKQAETTVLLSGNFIGDSSADDTDVTDGVSDESTDDTDATEIFVTPGETSTTSAAGETDGSTESPLFIGISNSFIGHEVVLKKTTTPTGTLVSSKTSVSSQNLF